MKKNKLLLKDLLEPLNIKSTYIWVQNWKWVY